MQPDEECKEVETVLAAILDLYEGTNRQGNGERLRMTDCATKRQSESFLGANGRRRQELVEERNKHSFSRSATHGQRAYAQNMYFRLERTGRQKSTEYTRTHEAESIPRGEAIQTEGFTDQSKTRKSCHHTDLCSDQTVLGLTEQSIYLTDQMNAEESKHALNDFEQTPSNIKYGEET